MSQPDDVLRTLARIAEELEGYATRLEDLMPMVRGARQALSDLAPGVARYSGFEGSVDAFDAAAGEGYGFARIDAARRRLVAAVREPMDDLPPASDS